MYDLLYHFDVYAWCVDVYCEYQKNVRAILCIVSLVHKDFVVRVIVEQRRSSISVRRTEDQQLSLLEL